ncbi:hypothetical protein O9992_29075 [Vibrio lentus]|nr:hypothetical protein [Vibrio lentus]
MFYSRPERSVYHLNDSDAKVYLCFEGSEEPPIGRYGLQGFEQANQCEYFIEMPLPTSSQELLQKQYQQHESITDWMAQPLASFTSAMVMIQL